jgi:hypothetical protein
MNGVKESELMMQSSERTEQESSRPEPTDRAVPSLFDKEQVHVSEIVGDMPNLQLVTTSDAEAVAPRRRRTLHLRLDWYDCGVILLVVATIVVALVCLIGKG